MTEANKPTPRLPDFPDVVVHMSLKTRNGHPAYPAAKAGDAMAAYALVNDVLNEESFRRVARLNCQSQTPCRTGGCGGN
jgi:hypothetical protein